MTSRKGFPLATGVLDYFPDALMAVAAVSLAGAQQHGTMAGDFPTWKRELSADHADALLRHLKDRGRLDTDKHRHSAKVAWRAMALLQEELEAEMMAEMVQQAMQQQQQQQEEITIPSFLTADQRED